MLHVSTINYSTIYDTNTKTIMSCEAGKAKHVSHVLILCRYILLCILNIGMRRGSGYTAIKLVIQFHNNKCTFQGISFFSWWRKTNKLGLYFLLLFMNPCHNNFPHFLINPKRNSLKIQQIYSSCQEYEII